MTKETTPVWFSILAIAFVAGALFAIGVKTGAPTDEGGISVFVTKHLCTAVGDIDVGITYNCGLFVGIMILLSIIGAVITIIEEAARMNNWRVGLAIYIIGWIIGVIYMLGQM